MPKFLIPAIIVGVILVILMNGMGGYNRLQGLDETVKASWSEVVNQYQRRADLIPNLVGTVKGYVQHEEKTLVEVTEARSHATSIQATPELVNDPEAFQKFQAAQGQLTGALSRLMAIAESYPDLKANTNFRDLSAQLEGTENRVTVARGRYIEAVQQYNTIVRSFPTNIIAAISGLKAKANFSVENEKEISTAPKVDFSK